MRTITTAFVILVVAFLQGCRTFQDVGPLYDQAREDVKRAEKLENAIILRERQHQKELLDGAFSAIHSLTKASLRSMLRASWDTKTEDWNEQDVRRKDELWRSWLAISPEYVVSDASVQSERMRIGTLLGRTQAYNTTNESGRPKLVSFFSKWSVGESPEALNTWITSNGGTAEDAQRIASDYRLWLTKVNTEVLDKAPACQQLVAAKARWEGSADEHATTRSERIAKIYELLDSLLVTAKELSKVLSDNATIIAVVNQITRTVKGLIGFLQED